MHAPSRSFRVWLTVALLAGFGLVASPAHSALAVSGAGFTTVNPTVDGPNRCLNGSGTINCNIYTGKSYVWLNGGPVAAALGNGSYFFSVLVPGGQSNPNDGAPNNLSDTTCAPYSGCSAQHPPTNSDGSVIPSGDAYTNRKFSISNGTISYSGTHDFNSNKIRLMPYDDTTNNGGVYIMAICSLAKGVPVAPSSCKYDAFKVKAKKNADLIVTKDATPTFTRTFTWNIQKDVDQTRINIAQGGTATFHYTVGVSHDNGTDSAWQVAGTIQVFNPNLDFAITGVNVSDAINDANASCAVTNGTNATIPAGDKVLFLYTCTYSVAPASSSQVNTATATWPNTYNTPHTSGSFQLPFSWPSAPTTIIDGSVTVTDTLGGTLGTASYTDPNPKTFRYPISFQGVAGTCTDYNNTATFTTSDTGTTGSASRTVTVCVGVDLTVSKTATPAFTRTYLWNITKQVDKTFVRQASGSATFNYTVNVSQTGYTDSGWAASGTITVANPNDWEAITANVTDATLDHVTCTVANGTGLTIPASSSIQLSYTCSLPTGDSRTNQATATWDKAAYFTPDGSAKGTASIAFVTPTNPVNQTITPVDSFSGGPQVNLCTLDVSSAAYCTLTATDSAPFTTHTYNYARTIAIPAVGVGCLTYPNTATIVETGQSDSKQVEVCGPVPVGGLTMGFWQNQNGQGLITNAGTVSGTATCKVTPFLEQYAPFQDLSSTATCSQVATYFVTVFNNASAGGTTMNPMLKAQMLATSLDVYFSDPSLGGSVTYNGQTYAGFSGLGAKQLAIGSLVIDLTSIGGSENVSAAFGGATTMTASQMLAYIASQSDAGGANWYGNNKTIQALAKDACDAINNSKVAAFNQ